jgi:hypothetical protein
LIPLAIRNVQSSSVVPVHLANVSAVERVGTVVGAGPQARGDKLVESEVRSSAKTRHGFWFCQAHKVTFFVVPSKAEVD